jgi:hypothetical protein
VERVGYARHRSVERGELYAYPTAQDDTGFVPFRATVLLFSKRVWQHAQILLAGAILAAGKRTVSSALRAMGLEREKRFHCYHRVLSRAAWSSKEAGRILLEELVEAH